MSDLEEFFQASAPFPSDENWTWREGSSKLQYISHWVDDQKAREIYEDLRSHCPWRQGEVHVYGRKHLTPRLECWVADPGVKYRYSNQLLEPMPWPSVISVFRSRLLEEFGHEFNACLVNYYRDGQDGVGWHADDEPELGPCPTIASLSFGVNRDFQIRPKNEKGESLSMVLGHGSLLLMSGSTQEDIVHQIPKRKRISDGRINLTFRKVYSKIT